MRTTVKKWGNSAVIQIPKSVMQAIHLRIGDEVEVRNESGRVVIEPVRRRVYKLEELLGGVTAKNQHDSVDFGPAVGKETG